MSHILSNLSLRSSVVQCIYGAINETSDQGHAGAVSAHVLGARLYALGPSHISASSCKFQWMYF